MKYPFLCLILAVFNLPIFGQLGLNADRGAFSLGVGGSGVALNGLDAVLNNFAGATELESFGLIASTQRRFLIEDLTTVTAGFVFPVGRLGHFGVLLNNYGFEAYSEQKFGVAYGKKLLENFAISGQLDIINTRIDDFGNKAVVTFDLGIFGRFGQDIYYGIHIFSPEQVKITESTRIPAQMRIGILYEPAGDLDVILEVEKTVDEALNVAGGINFKLADQLYARIGGNTNPGVFTMGIGYIWNDSVTTDGAYSYNTTLGITPGVSVKYKRP